MCDDIETTRYTLKKGTILYSGNSGKRNIQTLSDIFKYIGQRGEVSIKGEFVLYASSDYDTSKGYAFSCLNQTGFIHKFRVTRNIILWEQSVFEDADEVAKCVCSALIKGIVVRYSKHHDEYALCSPEDYLEYISTQKCIGNGKTSEEYNILDKVTAHDLVMDTMPY